MPFARCPICQDILSIGDAVEIDRPITCSTCLSNLIIASVDPLELEEARRAVRLSAPRPGYSQSRQPHRQEPAGGSAARGGGPPLGRSPAQERRPYLPPSFPPNPDKQVDGRRAQKWERPKQDDEEPEEIEEFEDKFIRGRGKGKRSK